MSRTVHMTLRHSIGDQQVHITNNVTSRELALGMQLVLDYKWYHFLEAWKDDRYYVVRAGDENLGLVILTDTHEVQEIQIFDPKRDPTLEKRVLLSLLVAREHKELPTSREPYIKRRSDGEIDKWIVI